LGRCPLGICFFPFHLQAKTAIFGEWNGIFDLKNLRNAEQNHNFGPKRKILMRGFSHAWPAFGHARLPGVLEAPPGGRPARPFRRQARHKP
jgi:hypothetical protein